MRLDGLQDLFGANTVVRDSNSGDYGVLPGIEMIDFGNRHVEALPQAVFQALHDVPLLFQRVRVFDVDIER